MLPYENSEALLKGIYDIICIIILSVSNGLIKGGERMRERREGWEIWRRKWKAIRGSS